MLPCEHSTLIFFGASPLWRSQSQVNTPRCLTCSRVLLTYFNPLSVRKDKRSVDNNPPLKREFTVNFRKIANVWMITLLRFTFRLIIRLICMEPATVRITIYCQSLIDCIRQSTIYHVTCVTRCSFALYSLEYENHNAEEMNTKLMFSFQHVLNSIWQY